MPFHRRKARADCSLGADHDGRLCVQRPYRIDGLGHAEPEIAASLALNRAIMDRMSVAAALYVGFLLEKVHRSNQDERRRLTRELHDVVAPSVAVGLQHLDLYEIYSDIEPGRAAAKVAEARQSLHDALSAMRTLSAESRESVGRGGLRYAVAAVLERSASGVKTFLNISGDLAALPSIYCEEIFLLVREAVRNAFNHARPSRVTVTFAVTDRDLTVYVVDDGVGFEVTGASAAKQGDGLGLISMAERAQLLGGKLTISSQLGEGATVTAQIPRPPSTLPAASGQRASGS